MFKIKKYFVQSILLLERIFFSKQIDYILKKRHKFAWKSFFVGFIFGYLEYLIDFDVGLIDSQYFYGQIDKLLNLVLSNFNSRMWWLKIYWNFKITCQQKEKCIHRKLHCQNRDFQLIIYYHNVVHTFANLKKEPKE